MKKILLFISVFLISLVCVNAGAFKGVDDYDTMSLIDEYVEKNIEYKTINHRQGITKTLKLMSGDCTDKAELKCYYANKEKLRCRTVHGYADGIRHDWVEYRINNEWITNERIYFNTLKKRGNWVW